ncbi:MAG: FecR domain-containing protein [Candidatus Neomarinimicrobiota bacterium]
MKRATIFFLLICCSVAWGADKIAFTTKVSGGVTLTTMQNQTAPLKRGTALNAGEEITVGADGMAVIMFIDDKSILRIQKNTTLTVGGETFGSGSNRAIAKQIDMQFGKLRAQISDQRRGEFQITTPTSVASVKGTDFWTTSDPVFGDIFLGVEGQIEVENLISGEVIAVGGGQVGASSTDGSIDVTTYVLLTSELLTVSDNLLTMEGSSGAGDEPSFNGQVVINEQTTWAGPEPTVGAQVTISGVANDDGSVTAIQVEVEEAGEMEEESINEMRIQLEDADGNVKEVIIIYQ